MKSYRLVSQNVFIAAMVVAGPALLVLAGWYTTNQQNLRFTWWSLPPICAVVGVFAVRALRRGVIVTDTALIVRSLASTRVVPWRCVSSGRVTPVSRRTRRLIATCDDQEISVLAYGRDLFMLQPAVDRAMAAAPDDATLAEPGPKAYHPQDWPSRSSVALWLSAAVLLIGCQVIESAQYHHEVYAARATRDVPGTAEVMSSHVDEDDSGEGPTTYTTVVDIRFFLGERQVDTSIERPGRLAFTRESLIPIVYDSLHPRDADFGDRHNRKANDASVHTRFFFGRTASILGLIACIGLSFVAVRNAAKSRGRSSVVRQTVHRGRPDRGRKASWPRV